MAKDAVPLLQPQERRRLAALENPRWWAEEPLAEQLRDPIMRLAAYYLMRVRRRDGRRAADPVAHFHLRNGARIERLNWLADRSAKGLRAAFGVMVNYRYDAPALASNSEAYNRNGVLAASREIEAEAGGFENQEHPR